MIAFPNAKMNFGLNIVARRTDGFHNIESVFYPIALCDALEFVETPKAAKTTLQLSGMLVEGNSDSNLVIKAYRLLQNDFDLPMLEIHLQKNIPTGAGLGGGSADGAFMLTMLNRHFDLKLTEEKLLAYATKLGSDCPFFIHNKPVFATKKGEEMTSIELSLANYYLALIKPPFSVSTADAYTGCTPEIPQENILDIIREPIERWHEKLVNDFEKTVFARHPQLTDVKAELYRQGAVYAAMSGSGSTIYGIFRQEPSVRLFFPDCFVWEGKLS